MIRIIPSLAAANQLNLQSAIESLKGVPYIHLDVEDGNFIPNITFGLRTIEAVARYSSKALDAHLMVCHPSDYVDALLDLGIRQIAVHIESLQYPAQILSNIKKRGGLAGLALNFQAPVDSVSMYSDLLDYVLIMTAEPDAEDQQFNPRSLQKISRARAMLPTRISIMTDGGISPDILSDVIQAGADTVIMGRSIWNHPQPSIRYQELVEIANQCDHHCS